MNASMARTIAVIGLLCTGFASSPALASWELGGGTVLAWNYESGNFSLGWGSDFSWTKTDGVGVFSNGAVQSSDVTVFTIEPALRMRLYSGREGGHQPFFVTQIGGAIPFASAPGSAALEASAKEAAEAVFVNVGGGVRTPLGDHLRIGGQGVLATRIDDGRVSMASTFQVFLQLR